jgi:hypothetical protein
MSDVEEDEFSWDYLGMQDGEGTSFWEKVLYTGVVLVSIGLSGVAILLTWKAMGR